MEISDNLELFRAYVGMIFGAGWIYLFLRGVEPIGFLLIFTGMCAVGMIFALIYGYMEGSHNNQ